jgi:hypothetical protein
MQLDLDLKSKEWMKDAYCASYPDPDLWHYESSLVKDERELAEWRAAEAIRMCRLCPVQEECLAEGMKQENMLVFNGVEGTIWGGKLQGERMNIRAGRMVYKSNKELVFLSRVNKKIAILDQ